MRLLLDTHVFLWLSEASPSLGRNARAICDGALAEGEVWLSAVSFYEIGNLIRRGRLIGNWTMERVRIATGALGVRERALDGQLAGRAAGLEALHGDPWDRILAATAIADELALVTADRKILRWESALQRIDAAR